MRAPACSPAPRPTPTPLAPAWRTTSPPWTTPRTCSASDSGAADALSRLNEVDDAIEILDHAIARAPREDWTDRARARMLLGDLYERGGRPYIAFEHYEYVAAQRHTHDVSLRERALPRLADLR